MATFNYIKAVWQNGPGVVSDAPDWALAAIEQALCEALPSRERELVGGHVDRESGLSIKIFVSPSAAGSESALEDSPHGSFVHVVASDRVRDAGGPDEARLLFESVYGQSLSDAALRQQRNFMLLEFPYHRALATDLFVGKDSFEDPVAPESPPPSTSLPAPAARDGLPFDLGLSYQEVVDRLADAALRQARTDPDSIPELRSARSREPEPVPEAPASEPRVDGGATDESPSLSSLLGRSDSGEAPPKTPDELPFDQGLSYQEVLSRVSSAVQEVPQAVPAATTIARTSPAPAFELGGAPPAPARKHRTLPRETSSPILVSAGFALFLLTVMGVIALRLSVAPVEARRVEIEVAAPAAVEPSPVAIETEPPRPVPVLPVVEEERVDPLVLAAVAPVAAERVAEAESAAETRAIPEELTWSAVEAAPVPRREPRAAAQLEPEAEPQLDPKATQPQLEPDPLPAVSAAIESTEPAPPAEPEVATSVERETREAERRRRERQRLMQQIQRHR